MRQLLSGEKFISTIL